MASNDFVISTNLVVFGMSTFTGGLTFDGAMILDVDSTEALLVRKDSDGGDVFAVDTVNDVVRMGSDDTFLTFGASSDVELHRDAADVLALRRGTSASVKEIRVYQANDPGVDVRYLQLGPLDTSSMYVFARRDAGSASTQLTLGTQGGSQGDIRITPNNTLAWIFEGTAGDHHLRPTAGGTDIGNSGGSATSVRTMYFGGGITSPIDAIVIDSQDLVGAGTRDSHAIIQTGISFDSGAHDADWKTFIEMPNNDGTGSLWTLQTRIDAASFVTMLTVDDSGTVTLPVANSFISLGPNTAASGDIRFGNTRFIAWRNDANDADFQALSVDESDILNIGVSTLTSVRVLNTLTVGPPATAQLILPISNDANTPTLAFGDGDSGFYEQGDDTIQLALAGGTSVRWNTTGVRSLVNGSWSTNHVVASATAPPFTFQGDTNTGMGAAAADQLSLIAGGVEVLRLSNATEFAQSRWSGAFTSDGSSNLATGALFGADITNASGDTALSQVRMGGTNVGGSLTTSGAGDSLLACTLWLDEPDITLTPSDSMTTAATLYISGAPSEGTSANLALFIDNGAARFDGVLDMKENSTFSNPAKTFTFGSGVAQTYAHVAIIGAFTSSGLSNQAAHLYVAGTLTGANGDTVSLAALKLQNAINTQGTSNTITDVAQIVAHEPVITVGAGDTITNASTLVLFGSPTEGTNNWALRSTGPAPSIFTGVQFIIGDSALDDWVQVLLSGSFTSGGSFDNAVKLRLEGTLTGASGDTAGLVGAYFDANITTQTETESIANISQVRIDEPNITDNLTGTITDAQTLLLVGSPTEGNENWTLRSTGAAPTVFQGLQFLIGTASAITNYQQFTIAGGFVSGGGSAQADKLRIQDSLTGASGDIVLNAAFFAASITTQTAAEVLTDVAQVRIAEPAITLGAGSSITSAQTLLIAGSPTEGAANYSIRSTGIAPTQFQGLQFIVGSSSVVDSIQFRIAGTFTSGGSGASAQKLVVDGTMVGASGDTDSLAAVFFNANITTQTATEDITNISQVRIDEPTITDNLTGNITNAQSLLIAGAPTEGVTNDALRIVSGSTQFPQGAEATPAIRFGNVGTGIYQNTTNDVLVSIDGISLVKVTDSGSINRMSFHSDLFLTWTSGTAQAGGPQINLGRESADAGSGSFGDLFLANEAALSVYQNRTASSTVYHRLSLRFADETLSSVSGASVTTANIIPAGALVLGVTTDVDVALGTTNGTTGYQIGDGSDADRWGDITGTATTTFSDDADFTTTTIDRFSAASAVTITAVGGNFDGTGDIVVVVHYIEIGARK